MNRRLIHGVHGRGMGVHAHATPIPRLCDCHVTPLKWTLRRRFIDVTPVESSKVAYYTPMPHLRFLTGLPQRQWMNYTANLTLRLQSIHCSLQENGYNN